MAATELRVSLCGRPVGHLVDSSDRAWRFIYDDDALDALDGPPVSLALPRQRAIHQREAVTHTFAALLPSGALQQRLARSLGISQTNRFHLLARVAGECHGGLRIEAPGGAVSPPDEPRDLAGAELRHAMNALLVHPLLANADGLRKTLPGEYDKLPVQVADGRVSIVFDRDLTTHILKPARPGLRESVYNEGFCMALAAAHGLPVADAEIVGTRVSVLQVARVDRRSNATSAAIHMEDFCQARGHDPERPYEREGGPRISEINDTLRWASSAPAIDVKNLLRWLIFGFMIGFGAGHGRQLALLLGTTTCRLAPFFGIWSTHVYPEMSYRYGFRIGGEDRPDWIGAARWIDCARECGIRPQWVIDELRGAARRLPDLAREVAAEFQHTYGVLDIVERIVTLVEQRARQSLVSIEARRGMKDAEISA